MVLVATRCQEWGWEGKVGGMASLIFAQNSIEKDLGFVVAIVQNFKLCKFLMGQQPCVNVFINFSTSGRENFFVVF